MKLSYRVVSIRTGVAVAAFMLAVDAQEYKELLDYREGCHGAGYEVKG